MTITEKFGKEIIAKVIEAYLVERLSHRFKCNTRKLDIWFKTIERIEEVKELEK